MTPFHNGHCLEDEDFYSYMVGSPGAKPQTDVEAHLLSCSRCRQELAALLRTLHPKPEEPSEFVQEQPNEIQDTLAFIQKASRREPRGNKWRQWGAIAAAAVVGIALLSAGSLYFYVRTRSQAFCSQARTFLQEVYEPRSPSDLRLDLPFKSEASQRSASNEEAFSEAEKFFNQALGAREGMSEAMLGLGYLHLRKNEFGKAELQFNAALKARSSGGQALLGRGVSRFEEGLSSADAVARSNYMAGALADFESVLKANPGSNEAQYNKIRVLYETGQHRQALQEIDAYLARDPDSIWAVKLRDLKIRLQMNRSELLEKEIDRAARERDAQALETLARIVPDRVPVAVTSLLRRALAIEGRQAIIGLPDSDALRWAAETLSSAYGNFTADKSCSRVLDFYAGLSPPQKQAKKALDARLEQLIDLFKKNELKTAFQRSESLIRDFRNLNDYWQMVRVYQLRGSSFYYSANFNAASAESLIMLKYAELTFSPELIARSLTSQASSYSALREYDKALTCLSRAKALAESYHLESESAFASHALGYNYFMLNRFEDSLREHSKALSIAYRTGDPVVVSCLENLGEVMERMHRYEEASSFLRLAADWQSTLLSEGIIEPTPETKAVRISLLYGEGYLALRTGNMPAAENYFGEAIRDSLDSMKELECLSRLGLAQVYFEEKKYREAETQADLVLGMTSQNKYPGIEWKAKSLKGFLLKQAGDEAAAIDYFLKAGLALERERANVASFDLRQSFFAQRFDPYRQIVSLLYHTQNDPGQALKYAERAKAMTLREHLSLNSDLADLKSPHPFEAASLDLLGSLPAGVIALEYFLSNDEFFVFVSTPNGIEAVSVGLPLRELESLVQKYLESIKNNDAYSFSNLSPKLHELLIDPILKKVESLRPQALVILPDGPLHLVPFGSLMDSNGHYLLEKFALSYAPSCIALQYCLSKRKTGRITPESSIVFLDGTSNLPGAGKEMAFLARLYPRTNKILDGRDLQPIGSIVENTEIIHFSGHAELYQGTPRLIFHTSHGETYLDSSVIQKWHLRKIRLVTLAGCNTGIGPIFEGETPWGLVPSFLSAGAPSILVSLLPVDDAATGNLTSKFYEFLTHGTSSKAQALQLAQLSLLKSLGSEAQRRPLLWAPFVLVGDPF